MLAVSTYPIAYIQATRMRIARQLAAYDILAQSADTEALAAFEPEFFNGLVLELDHAFMHRARGREGKDGNPINEVRVLAASIVQHDAVMTSDRAISLLADRSVLGLAPGEEIRLTRRQLGDLADAYLIAIADRYGES